MGGVNAKRRPWWVDMSNPTDPNPTMWIGDAGSTHPYTLPLSPDTRRSAILGALDESTSPPTFFHYVSQNHPNLPLADKALSHVQRAYYQMKDDPSKRTASSTEHDYPTPPELLQHEWHQPDVIEQMADGVGWYGDEVRPDFMSMPLYVMPDNRWSLGYPGQSHAYDWSAEAAQEALGIRDMGWDERGKYQGGVNVGDDGASLHWPDAVPFDPKIAEQIMQKAWNSADKNRRYHYDNWHEKQMQAGAPGYTLVVDHPELGKVTAPVPAEEEYDPYDVYHKAQGWPMVEESWGSYPNHYPHHFIAPNGFEFGHRFTKTAADFDPTRGSIVYHKGDDRMVDAPFDKRRIYLYDPDRDILHWGNPGQWHGDIRRDALDWYTKNGLQPPHYADLIAGAVGETDRGDKLHGVYSPDPMGFEGKSGNERYDRIYDRLHELTGVPVTPNMTPDSMLDMFYPPDAGMGYGSSDWKIASDGADYLTQSGDDWWGPQSVNLQHVDVPGEAPGMGDPAHLPANALLKNPCYCDVGSTTPHEWTGSCENGKHPIMEHEATVIPDGWVKDDLDPKDDGWDDGGQWDTDTFLDHNIINQHLKTQQQAQEYLDYLDRQNRKPEWPDIGVREAADNVPGNSMQDSGHWFDLTPHCITCGGDHLTNECIRNMNTMESRTPSVVGQDDWASLDPRFAIGSTPDGQSNESSQKSERLDSRLIVKRVQRSASSALKRNLSLRSTHLESPAASTLDVRRAMYEDTSTLTPSEDNLSSTITQAAHSNVPSVDLTNMPVSTSTTSMVEGIERETKKVAVGPHPIESMRALSEKGSLKGSAYSAATAIGSNILPDQSASNNAWVWLDGHVGFGTDHGNIAKDLANTRGYDPTKVNYISNMVSRNLMPEGHAIAVGTLKQGYPHIWMSTVDRNLVFDDIIRSDERQRLDRTRLGRRLVQAKREQR